MLENTESRFVVCELALARGSLVLLTSSTVTVTSTYNAAYNESFATVHGSASMTLRPYFGLRLRP